MSSYSTERKEAILIKLLPPLRVISQSLKWQEKKVLLSKPCIIGVIKQENKVSQCQVRNQHQINGHMKRSSRLLLKQPLYLNQN